MAKKVYDVLREHEGDRFYKERETRELDEADARHLVTLGVLAEHVAAPAAKAEPAVENKQEETPLNKAELAAATRRAKQRKA